MRDRIEGATLPGYNATIVDDTGQAITDGLQYTWVCEASLYNDHSTVNTVGLGFTKTAGIIPIASGFTVSWLTFDIGSLVVQGCNRSQFLLEFTGTKSDGAVLKHHESFWLYPDIP